MIRTISRLRTLWLLVFAASVPAVIAQEAPRERFRAVDAFARPGYTLQTIDNETLSADAWDGKVVLVDFWASWCIPCRKEMPEFNRLRAEYAEQGFEVVGIAADELEKVQEFLGEVPVDFPIVYGDVDAVMEISEAYGNDYGGLPFSAFIDRDGNVRFTQRPGLVTFEDAQAVIESLL